MRADSLQISLPGDLLSGLRSGEPLTVRSFTGMQSFYFSISRPGLASAAKPVGLRSTDGRGGCHPPDIATSARGYPPPMQKEWVRKAERTRKDSRADPKEAGRARLCLTAVTIYEHLAGGEMLGKHLWIAVLTVVTC